MKSFIPNNVELQKAELDNFFSKARLAADDEKNKEMLTEARKSMESLMSSYNKLMSSDQVEDVFLADFKTCYQNAVQNLNVNAGEIPDALDKEECIQRTERLWNYMGVHTLRKDPAQILSDTLERSMDDDFDKDLRESDFSEVLHSSEKLKVSAEQIMKDFDILYQAGGQMPTTAEGRKDVVNAIQDIYDQLQKSNCNVEPLEKHTVKDSETLLAYTKACEAIIYDALQINPHWTEKKDENDKKQYRDLEEVLLEGIQKKPVIESEKKDEKTVEKSEAKKEEAKKNDDAKRIDEKEINKAVEKSTTAVNKRVKNVQKSLDELAKGGRGRALTEDDLIGGMLDFQRGELPQNDVIQYLQDLQESRRQNYQNGGAMEDNLLQERRDTIKGIGDEYQANREVTPALVEKKERLDAIDNVLINVTKYPKLLFLSMILMGLNPFLAIGLSVLAAFSKDMVQDIYKNLPKEDKSNLENRPAQQPQQPVDNKQIEEYQQKLAQAVQIVKAQRQDIQKFAQRDAFMSRIVQGLYSQMYAEREKKERIEAEKAKAKLEVKAEKKDKPAAEKKENTKVTNENAAAKQNPKSKTL